MIHKDPFDRVLIAQATVEDLTLQMGFLRLLTNQACHTRGGREPRPRMGNLSGPDVIVHFTRCNLLIVHPVGANWRVARSDCGTGRLVGLS